MEKRGLVLVAGATGSGKSTTLAAMIDHRNANTHRPHPDDRGPDRVPVRAQAEPRQPARDRRRHAQLPHRAAERAARGARPHHDRRNPRQGDDAGGAAPYADRPPVPVDDPRQQQLPRAVADHQPVPPRRALGRAVRPVDRPARDRLAAAGPQRRGRAAAGGRDPAQHVADRRAHQERRVRADQGGDGAVALSGIADVRAGAVPAVSRRAASATTRR